MPPNGTPRQLSSLALGAVLALGWLTVSGGAIALVTLTGDSYQEYPVEPSFEPTDTYFPTYFPTARPTTRTTRPTTRRTTATTTGETTTTGPFGGFGGQR
ncbi:hypothetical protein N8J89_38915 [Crossiella sp. CA-258035]|uniref:hypothetical protein n=1 Tax=Crossiella sp. CA-258035 TaxID=2981138 RepID=UPI0024BC211B|nr:hypothetical protein [Crossiella sp. CA-258035]WHT19004.1 hypothetical protein N8J89_38915 [Crossiella sp. CA-258035]